MHHIIYTQKLLIWKNNQRNFAKGTMETEKLNMTNLESLQKMLNARGEFNKIDKNQNSDTGN